MMSTGSRTLEYTRRHLMPAPPAEIHYRNELTTGDVAKHLGISRQKALRLLESGAIPHAYQSGNRWLIGREALERHLSGTPAADPVLTERVELLEREVRLLRAVAEAQVSVVESGRAFDALREEVRRHG